MNAQSAKKPTPSLIKPPFTLPKRIAADVVLLAAIWLIVLARIVAAGVF